MGIRDQTLMDQVDPELRRTFFSLNKSLNIHLFEYVFFERTGNTAEYSLTAAGQTQSSLTGFVSLKLSDLAAVRHSGKNAIRME